MESGAPAHSTISAPLRALASGLRIALLILTAVLPPGAATAQETARPSLRVGVLPDSFRLTGSLSDPAWNAADEIENLTTTEPIEGGVPVGRTWVKVLANRSDIVIGIVCEDPDPSSIVGYSKARDSEFEGEDAIRIVLDTFLDGRSGYIFAVNPEAARFDALITGPERDNSDWDTIWEAKAARDSTGWRAEIRLPLKSLSFRRELREWGFNVERQVPRFQETSRWASPRRDYRITQTSRAGLLTDLPDFAYGVGLTLRPALVGDAAQPELQSDAHYSGDPSLDAAQRLGPNLLASLTVNTDFAETEVDTRRTNLTRFPLFFPEKRTFFLEGADIFSFGGFGQDVIPFFSRRIGLLAGVEVPLVVGGKLNGRVGQTNLGALAVHTGDVVGLVSPASMGVVRVSQNFLEESSVGMIATFGDPQDRQGAWTAGVDFNYQTSHFRGDKNFSVGVAALTANRDGLTGDKSAVAVVVDYPNDTWDNVFSYRRIGDGFDPSLGFVPRRAVQSFAGGLTYRYRPEVSPIRWNFFELRPTLVTDLGGSWESYRVFMAPINLRFDSADRIELNIAPQGERLVEPFEIADDVVIPPGSYHFTRYRLEAETAPQRPVSGQVTWWFGRFYDGDLHEISLELAWKPSALVNVELSSERNIGTLPQGDFTQQLFGARLNLNFSPDLVLNSFVQYDDLSRSVGTNTRLRWTFAPAGDLFVVYNHNLLDLEDRWVRESRQLVVKLQYAFRY